MLMFRYHLVNWLCVQFVYCSKVWCSISIWANGFLFNSYCSKHGVQITVVQLTWKAPYKQASLPVGARAVILLGIAALRVCGCRWQGYFRRRGDGNSLTNIFPECSYRYHYGYSYTVILDKVRMKREPRSLSSVCRNHISVVCSVAFLQIN